ncbi:MAG: cytochrome b/b6 domain-containing protein [Coriobacteriia bacterium]|nr:cytochrome b/b6 domain-containing protein [Coriobacteriia bacterium]
MGSHTHYREAHPLVFVITHWINLICMVMLAFSGFYIHFPFFSAGFMGVARGMHFVAMYVILINLVFRIVAAFFVKTANQLGTREVDTDIKNWLPQAENRHQLVETLKYYLFFRKEGVISGKYGSLQKIAYLATVPLTFIQAYTGFAIYAPFADASFLAAGTTLVGGPMNMRIIHYFGMWVFILFTMVHAYLANIYNFAPSKIIFLWKETLPGSKH